MAYRSNVHPVITWPTAFVIVSASICRSVGTVVNVAAHAQRTFVVSREVRKVHIFVLPLRMIAWIMTIFGAEVVSANNPLRVDS